VPEFKMTNRVLLVMSVLALCSAACNSPATKHTKQESSATANAPAPATTVDSPAAAPAPHTSSAHQAATTPAAKDERAALTRVGANSEVCMVNNTYMGSPQIPVEVAGRTYYGCCEMCKGKLESDPASRVATDPVSGRSVDKASAVIGRDARNRVLYFESESTYRKYAGS
jgi:YHS domain-containing protein